MAKATQEDRKQVTDKQYQDNWDRIFKKKKVKK